MTTATVAPHAAQHVAAQTGSPLTGVPSLLRLALRQISLHRKAGLGKVDGVFVVRQASRSF